MTDENEDPRTLATALDTLRDQVFLAIDENGRGGFISPERVEKIRDAAAGVERLGLSTWMTLLRG